MVDKLYHYWKWVFFFRLIYFIVSLLRRTLVVFGLCQVQTKDTRRLCGMIENNTQHGTLQYTVRFGKKWRRANIVLLP